MPPGLSMRKLAWPRKVSPTWPGGKEAAVSDTGVQSDGAAATAAQAASAPEVERISAASARASSPANRILPGSTLMIPPEQSASLIRHQNIRICEPLHGPRRPSAIARLRRGDPAALVPAVRLAT